MRGRLRDLIKNDNQFHTVTCLLTSTKVTVSVDGAQVAQSSAIGNISSSDPVDLGGQGPKANADSIDGQYQTVKYTVG